MVELFLAILFWGGSALLVYTFLGYPVLVHSLGKSSPLVRTSKTDTPPSPPSVSVVLIVRNEGSRIDARLQNLLDTHHPIDSLEIIVVSDGSDDDTVERAKFAGDHVNLIEKETRRGKPACLNDGVSVATGELIVFADARQKFTPETIPALVRAFTDPEVGAVSGELIIVESETGIATGVDAYWKLEKAVRLGESRLDSSIGCTGAIYAIRRELFRRLPDDTLLDDVVCPMQIALQDKRVLFEPEAVAYDPQHLEPSLEQRRKRRTLAGNFQMLFRYPSWLVPWKNRLILQLISHKYLRLLAPVLLVHTLVVAVILAALGSPFFLLASLAQGTFYLLAVVGMLLPGTSRKCFSLPAGFVFLNIMTVLGFFDYLRGRHQQGW